MRGYKYLIGVFLFVLSACGGNDSPPAPPRPKLVGGPLVIKIDPKDKERFAAIRTAPISERKKRQVEFLQSYGHDLQWFPETIGEIETSDTVQIIYFDYNDEATGWCSGKFISDNFVAT